MYKKITFGLQKAFNAVSELVVSDKVKRPEAAVTGGMRSENLIFRGENGT